MELNGARSNPRAGVELSRLGTLHDELLRRASINPREPRPAPAKVSPVLETVTLVLELAGEPMRARDIHATACELVVEPLLWKSVKAALAACAEGSEARFERVRRGCYRIKARACATVVHTVSSCPSTARAAPPCSLAPGTRQASLPPPPHGPQAGVGTCRSSTPSCALR